MYSLGQAAALEGKRTMEPKDENLAFLAGSSHDIKFTDVEEILMNYKCAGI